MRKLVVVLLLFFINTLALPWVLRSWVHWRVGWAVYEEQAVPARDVALVLGAGLRRDGSPTSVLYDRVATAVDLYKQERVKKLLLSGDNQTPFYNEPEAMRRLALRLGVPEQDIVLDFAGRRTYDSCYRAREIFQVDRAVVVTQRFHLNRALYLCKALGIEAVGVPADRRAYRPVAYQFWQLRETAATVRAWLDINILQPQPVLGEKLPIEIANQEPVLWQ